MSKIQKALESLRTNTARDVPEGSGPSSERMPVTSSERPRTSPRLPENGHPAQPKSHIKVDLRQLVASGLLPSKEDAQLISDQFRRVKRPILQLAFPSDYVAEANANVIMMASPLSGAGKSFCTLNLARSIAMEMDVGAVLVDADVLKPGISADLGLQNRLGLIDYLVDPDLDLREVLIATDMDDIYVLPAGRQHPEATELLASRRMKQLITLLSQTFRDRAILFDTPPLLITNEAQVLAEHMGQVVFVVEATSSRESALRAVGMLDAGKPINAILNKSRSASRNGYGGDDYGYYSYPPGDRRQ